MLNDMVLAVARQTAERYLGAFFEGVGEADPAALVAERIHPGLAEVGEVAVVAAMLKLLATRFGAFQGIEPATFAFEEGIGDDGRKRRYEGTFVFEGGAFPLTLGFLGDLVSTLNYGPELGEAIGLEAHRVPSDTRRHVARGMALVEALVAGDAKAAHAMLAPDLQAAISPAWVPDLVTQIGAARAGARITYERGAASAEEPNMLDLKFFVEGDEATVAFDVRFGFAAMQAGIVGLKFDFNYRLDVLAERSTAFLEALLAGRIEAAHAMFPPDVRGSIALEALAEICTFAAGHGGVVAIAPLGVAPNEEDPARLEAGYHVRCANGELAARVSTMLTADGAKLFAVDLRPAEA